PAAPDAARARAVALPRGTANRRSPPCSARRRGSCCGWSRSLSVVPGVTPCVHFGYGGRKVGNDPRKRQRQSIPATDDDVIMSGLELAGASPEGSAQPPPDAIALGRIAGLVGDGQPHARDIVLDGNGLQRESGPASPHAARRIEE